MAQSVHMSFTCYVIIGESLNGHRKLIQNSSFLLSYTYTVLQFQSWLFYQLTHVSIYICYNANEAFVIKLYVIEYCCLFHSDYFNTLFIYSFFICFKVMRHNVIIGQLYGGRLELVQIRPLIKEGLCHPSKKSQNLL